MTENKSLFTCLRIQKYMNTNNIINNYLAVEERENGKLTKWGKCGEKSWHDSINI